MKHPLIAAFLLLVISSSAQIGAKVQQSPKITGLWQNSQFGYQMTLMLNADGSGEFDGEMIRYTTKGSTFSMTVVDQNETTNYTYQLNGNSLTISGGDLDQPVTFTRNGTEQSSANPTVSAQQTTTANNPVVDKTLLGAWSGNGETIDFKPNGQVIYLGSTYRYEANKGIVALITDQGSVVFNYSIAGSQLTLSANGKQVSYTKGTGGSATTNNNSNNSGRQVPQELVGKWCWISTSSTYSGGSSSQRCIVLNGNGTYTYNAESSSSVNTSEFAGGTASQSGDSGTWWVEGDRIFYNSPTNGQGSYRLEKRNHPKNVNDPMIVLDGQPYVTAYNKAPWR